MAGEQIKLIVDSLNDAIRDTARVIGTKRIAKELWPEKSEEDGARYLSDCLNPDRAQRLSGEQILFVGRRGREIGCHILAHYINADLGYAPPIPIEPEDVKADLIRRFNERADGLIQMASEIKRISGAK